MTDNNNALSHLAGKIALLGICCDENSTFMRGPAEAPPKIRHALHDGSANLTSESGLDLEAEEWLADAGDRQIPEGEEGYFSIEGHITEVLDHGAKPLILGGDHAITYPVLRAVAKKHGPLDILHFDAHCDLYESYEGNRLSHACPFTRILEEGLARRLVQVGIRTLNAGQKPQVERFGVEVHEMRDFDVATFRPEFAGPIYLSFDMDCLDPAFAPGISHFEPGGFSVRDVLRILHRVDAPVLAADIVEYNPRRDVHDRTAMVAAKLVKEISALMAAS